MGSTTSDCNRSIGLLLVLMLVLVGLGCSGSGNPEARAKVAGSYRLQLTEDQRKAVPAGTESPAFLLTLQPEGTFELKSQRPGVPDEAATGTYSVLGTQVTVSITRVDGQTATGPERETLSFEAVDQFQALRQGDGSIWKRLNP